MAQKSYIDKAGATKIVENIKAIESDIYTEIGKKADASHTHAIADVTGLQTKLNQLNNKVEYDTLYDLTASTGSSNGAVTIDLKSGGTSSVASETDSIHINGSGATTVTTDAVGTITIDSTDTTYNVVTTSTEGLMAPSDKEKLDGIDYNANNYVLPVAGKSAIGGVLSGGDITVDSSGMVTVNNDSHTHGAGTITSVSASAIEGVISEANLPSYVDDVVEYDTRSAFPATGESGKIYVTLDTNLTYRWGGSGYVEISPSIALGETSSTAYRGDYGVVAYAHASAKGSAFSSGLYKIATNAEGHVTGATAVTKSDITSLGISGTEHTHNYAGSSSAGGAATSAVKLNTSAGSGTQPVYFSNGKPVATSYSLNKTVPSDAEFTDTTYDTGTASTAGITKLYTGTGTATDGTMTQAAIKSALDGKAASSHGNHVPATEAVNNAKFLRNDNTWQIVTPANIGAAASSHNQASNTINAMTGYSKASSVSAIATSDSLNTAIGKLEKALDGKQASGSYAAASHTHTKSQITDFPSSLKNPNSLTISLNGTSQGAYDGSAAKSIDITPANIGAAPLSHVEDTAIHLPSGGTAGQVLKKTDTSVEWANNALNDITVITTAEIAAMLS